MALTFRVSETLAALLKQQAQAEHTSVQKLLEKAAAEYLGRHGKREAINEAMDWITVEYADVLRRLGE